MYKEIKIDPVWSTGSMKDNFFNFNNKKVEHIKGKNISIQHLCPLCVYYIAGKGFTRNRCRFTGEVLTFYTMTIGCKWFTEGVSYE